MSVQEQLEVRRKELNRKQAENGLHQAELDSLEKKILGKIEDLDVCKEALVFLEQVANSRRGDVKGKIEDCVTQALAMIYGPSYRVELTYSMKNNRSHMDIEMVRDIPAGEIRRDPITGAGGGVADTISVPLRLMVLAGSRKTDRVVILDECWKHIDLDRVDMVGNFLRELTDKLGMQVILLSHLEAIRDYAERTFEVSEKDGVSMVSAN